jgi:hypothetical protein
MSRQAPLALALSLALAGLGAAEEKGELKFTVYGPYFESNKSGLKGDSSYLVFKEKAAFDKIFGSGRVMKKKPELLPKDYFDKHIVIAAIKRGGQIFTYDVSKVTVDDGVVRITYKATGKGGGGTARFASPLIVGVPKGEYKSVEFVEQEKGKKDKTVETIKLGK